MQHGQKLRSTLFFSLAKRSHRQTGTFLFLQPSPLNRDFFFFFSTAQWTLCFWATSSGGLNSLSRPPRMVQCYWKTDSSCRQVENVPPLGCGRKAASSCLKFFFFPPCFIQPKLEHADLQEHTYWDYATCYLFSCQQKCATLTLRLHRLFLNKAKICFQFSIFYI